MCKCTIAEIDFWDSKHLRSPSSVVANLHMIVHSLLALVFLLSIAKIRSRNEDSRRGCYRTSL